VRRLLREPLVHFVLLGAALFAVWALLAGPPGPRSDRIVVTESQVAHLAELFRRTWGRDPTREELGGLIDDHVREEIFYREALAMGLDRDDTIVRRRLRQKLEFVVRDVAATQEPTEDELRGLLREYPERFRREPEVSFEHVFVNAERRGATARHDAEALLAALRAGDLEPGAAGDAFALPARVESARRDEIARDFGASFVSALADLPMGSWEGPIDSVFGLHLVRIAARDPGGVPPFEEIRDRITEDWRSERRERANEALFARLRERYSVEVAPGAVAAGASP
jgi:hypothetical protein